ncbi:uncharacterized protein ColSpa_00039 [Colletotrichum spaethianum]|uniref:DUF7371 domain-containing protein n=1 Tax=Colletotrichum spaethianum TaxID=700344 RepID=A0AA37L5A6_9PEZI|nr:uncharacterized protein ColSpa_00039 [Colletotrichum spaethianum]GKT39858.1 hypothetical protein ColSpa_00039 [Colletotrichum spaethianum]
MWISLMAMMALVAGVFAQPTCPAAATATVFVTVDSANDAGASIVVQTVTATVLPSAQFPWSPASPSIPATLTVTIDSYDPPAGSSQFTGPKPWESSPAQSTAFTVVTATVAPPSPNPPVGMPPASAGNDGTGGQQSATTNCPSVTTNPDSGGNADGVTVITTTLLRTNANLDQATPSVDTVVATFTVTFPRPAATGSVPGSASTTGTVDPASGELFTYTVTAPAATGSPSVPGNDGAATSFTTTLYRTRPGSAQGTLAVDTLVTCFTVTFPSATGTAPAITGVPVHSANVPGGVPGGGIPGGSVGTTTRYIPTMVPGPDGSLSYSIDTVVSTFTAPTAGYPPIAGSSVITTVIPAYPSDRPSDGVATVVTTTLYASPASASTDSQPMDHSNPSVVVLTLTIPQPSGGGPATYTTVLASNSGDIGIGGASTPAASTATIIQVVPGSGSPTSALSVITPTLIPGGYGDPFLPGASGVPASGVPASGIPASGGPISGVVPPSGQTPAFPWAGSGASQGTLEAPVTVSVPASGVDTTAANDFPGGYGDSGQTGVPPFVPGPAVILTVTQATPVAGFSTPLAGVPTSLVGVPASNFDGPTSIMGGYGSVVVVNPATLVSFPQATPSVVTLWPVTSGINSALPAATTKTSCSSTLSSEVASTAVLTRTLVNSTAIHKRYVNTTATVVTPVPTPICTGTTEVGNLNLDFDDVSTGPFFNPYHRFWFSKGFLVGPPPLMPFLPSSGGRLIEFVPPILSNTSADNASGDTAQIGMGKLASSPCFQFDFLGMNLGCHSDSAVPNQIWYRWDASATKEIEAISQDAWVNACNKPTDCPLTPFSAVEFTGLSSILVTLRVDGRPQVWWADDLRVGWSKNDCVTASCRRQTQPTVSQHHGPIWYWTPTGLRAFSSSRINRVF